MASGWGPLAGVAAVLLLFSSLAWPSHQAQSISSTAQALLDPGVTRYDGFDPASASLKLVQVVFRHGARTPLNTIYRFPGTNWSHCPEHYPGVEVQLFDENGAPEPPPIIDMDTPVLPGGCRQGTLTSAGYGMALKLGAWLRHRYVDGHGSTGGFLPDLLTASTASTTSSRGSSSKGRRLATAAAAAAGAKGAGVAANAAGNGVADPSFELGRTGSRTDGVVRWDSAVASLRTTTIRRTVATLRGVVTGLWPGLAVATEEEGEEKDRRSGAPLPVAASVESLEIMYGNNRTCARLQPLYDAMQRDLNASDARDAELPRLNRLVAQALGLDQGQEVLWTKLYDVLAGMIADGQPLPPGATQEVLKVIWEQAERHEASIIGPGADLCASLGPGGDGAGEHEASTDPRVTDDEPDAGYSNRGSSFDPYNGAEGDAGSNGVISGSISSSARRRRCHEVLRLGIGLLLRRLLDNMEAAVAAIDEEAAASAGAGGAAAVDSSDGTRRSLRNQQQQGKQQQHKPSGSPAALTPTTLQTSSSRPHPSKLYLYSGHDSSVTPLLAVLGQPATAWPPFTANVVFELWQGPVADGSSSSKGGSKGGSSSSRGGSSSSKGGAGTGGGSRRYLRERVGEVAGGDVTGRRGLVGRKAVEEASGASEEGAVKGGGDAFTGVSKSSGYWVRILYNGKPLVIPLLSDAGGWLPLSVLRTRVFLPYAIRPEEHAEVCSRVDIRDLDSVQPPTGDWETKRKGKGKRREVREGWQDEESLSPARRAARERAMRHALL
ncbi:hypothetical protein Agub_g15116 [Astrephomene gubernaculifera]|uniref:Acid phosphatase n=1 Tax=Astrephomene gubernaculifera TaxID=47775 RepID=A0AAD3E2I7_9CHLO|nr:hypothetical protein Agub_g15116 [Astrephomene gubernaculifera]